MSERPTNEELPPSVIDALINYAIDPANWERLAQQLERNGSQLADIHPNTLFAALSHAEALAWQLKGQSDGNISQTGCGFYLLDEDDTVLSRANDTFLADYCRVDNGRLTFTHPASQASYRQARRSLADPSLKQALVELTGDVAYARYGYLVRAQDLPAALSVPNQQPGYGLLVANADASAQTSAVLQSSFALTNAEIAVCQQLSLGLKLKDVAHHLNISTNTARNHLQSIFDKTHINRQGDLILMMTQLSVILSVISTHRDSTHTDTTYNSLPAYQFVIVESDSTQSRPRRIAYRRYGNGQHPVIYFHESAGSSRLPATTHALCNQLNLSLIVFERPGSGFSDELDGYTFATVAQDVEHFVDELGIKQCSLLGYLSGGGHSLAAAAQLGGRVRHVMLVAARGTGGISYQQAGPLAGLRRNLTAQPWLLSTFFNILRNRASRDTHRRLLERIYGSVEQDKQLLRTQPELLEHLVDCTLESLTVTGAGIAGEIRCYTHPTEVALENITAPISVWHGEADAVANFEALNEELAGMPFTTRLFPGWGSLILHAYWQDILAHLAEQSVSTNQPTNVNKSL